MVRRMLLEEVTFTLNTEILKNAKYVTIMKNEKQVRIKQAMEVGRASRKKIMFSHYEVYTKGLKRKRSRLLKVART